MYKLEGFASYSMTLDFVSIHEMAPTDEMALENWIPNPYGGHFQKLWVPLREMD